MHIIEKNIRLETAKQSLVKTHFCLSNRTNPPKKNERKEIKKESINLSETQNIYEKHTKKLTIFSMAYNVRSLSLKKPNYGYHLQELSVWESQITSDGHSVNRHLRK